MLKQVSKIEKYVFLQLHELHQEAVSPCIFITIGEISTHYFQGWAESMSIYSWYLSTRSCPVSEQSCQQMQKKSFFLGKIF
jgi:hypothetical protein